MLNLNSRVSLFVVAALLAWGGLGLSAAQAGESGSGDANKAIVRRYYEEVYTRGNLGAIDELVAPSFAGHNYLEENPSGREALKQFAVALRSAFPDVRFQIQDQMAEGDKVVTRWIMRGTHQGPLRGVAPTGKRVQMSGLIIHRIREGKIVEGWSNADELGLMRQLGAIAAAGSAR